MITPTLNINGSHKDDLFQPRWEALDHINDVIECLKQVTPNGRDYPGDLERCDADRKHHYDRIHQLKAIYNEIHDEALAIWKQAKEGK